MADTAIGVPDALAARNEGEGAEGQLWIYVDLSGQEQGPFSLAQMRDWYAQGYFDAAATLVREPHGASVVAVGACAPIAAPARPAPEPELPQPAACVPLLGAQARAFGAADVTQGPRQTRTLCSTMRVRRCRAAEVRADATCALGLSCSTRTGATPRSSGTR